MPRIKIDYTSSTLKMNTAITVILPTNIDCKTCKIVYLLHGLSDNSTAWERYTRAESYAIVHNVALVMPEVQRSFYADMAYGLNYFKYITEELPDYLHRTFSFSTKREDNYVMGLSMGGYGALKCALTFPEKYAGCGAFSSAIIVQELLDRDTGHFREGELISILGDGQKIQEHNDVFKLAAKTNEKAEKPKIYMTCGFGDDLYQLSVNFKAFMDTQDYDLLFETWEGIHDWDFWDESLKKAFKHFFPINKNETEEK